ncbi:MAG: hypothetical protein JXB39_04415 [Deltaproteobacteria bacterium]|nr:hypothetical protein [Deltaproteobacteria bacterium]
MDAVKALLATIGILFLMVSCFVIFGRYTVLPWTIFLTAFWAAWDYEGYEGGRFATALPRSSVGVFFLVGVLWPVGFPLYLMVRERIWEGKVSLRSGAGSRSSSSTVATAPER